MRAALCLDVGVDVGVVSTGQSISAFHANESKSGLFSICLCTTTIVAKRDVIQRNILQKYLELRSHTSQVLMLLHLQFSIE